MSRRLRFVLIVLADVLHSVRWPNDLRWAILSFGRPHRQAGQEAAVGHFQFDQGVGDITAIQSSAVYSRVSSGSTYLRSELLQRRDNGFGVHLELVMALVVKSGSWAGLHFSFRCKSTRQSSL